MITAIAIDDEPLALNLIQKYCLQSGRVQLLGVFTNHHEAIAFLQQHQVDLLFLDIQMPEISGIEIAKKVGSDVNVIFTTAYSEYAVEGFNLRAIDYLLKPFEYERFLQAIERLISLKPVPSKSEEQFLSLKADYGIVRIPVKDILYVEGVGNYVKFHIENSKPVLIRMSVTQATEKLCEFGFLRVHRSYVIPSNRVSSVTTKQIFLGQLSIPLGINYSKDIMRQFAQ